MHIAKKVAFALVIIGGLNWGVYGVSGGYNLVEIIFGSLPKIESIVYVLVGLSALFMLLKQHKACCCSCQTCDSGDHCKECCSTENKTCDVTPTGEVKN
jgi:uncharacterized membrane protein YuzA (DUF378 family)